MCNYCNVTENRLERMIDFEPMLKKSVDCVGTAIETYNGKAYLTEYLYESDDDSDIVNIYAAQISYCPMCGRQLDE